MKLSASSTYQLEEAKLAEVTKQKSVEADYTAIVFKKISFFYRKLFGLLNNESLINEFKFIQGYIKDSIIFFDRLHFVNYS